MLAANFALEIQLFLVQLFLELGDLPIRQPVLDRDGDLLRHLCQQLDIGTCKRVFAQAADVERAKNAIVRMERNATERLHSLCQEVLRDLRLGRQRDEIPLGEHCRRSRRKRDTARRLHVRVGPALFHEALVLRHFQDVAAVLTCFGLVQHQAAAVVLNHLLQRSADRGEDVVHVEVRDDRVVHLEKQPEPIALARELELRRLHTLVVQDVVHGDGDLLRHLLHEGQIAVPIFVFLQAAKSHRAQPPEGRRQRDGAKRLHAVVPQSRDDRREPMLERDVIDDERQLRLPYEAAGGVIDRELRAGFEGRVHRRDEQLQPHHVSGGIVKHEVDVVERDDAREAMGEIAKEFVQVTM